MSTFDFAIVKNPEIFEQNRLPAHSDHRFYIEETDRQKRWDCRLSLNGIWRFSYAVNPGLAPAGFEKPGYDCSGWDQIRVPGHLQTQGYDVPAYVNTQYPWDGREEVEPGEIPTRFNPTGSYVRTFTLPERMKGLPLYISFQGVESGFALWLNGEYVGYSEDSFTPSEFDLTPYVREGENRLAVQVYKWTAGSWCEDQDFFRFSGIHREVFLYVTPPVHIRDLRIRTLLDDDYLNAVLRLEAQPTAPGRMNVTLQSPDGATVFTRQGQPADQVSEQEVVSPLLWSAESPSLYDLLIEVTDPDGMVNEVIHEKVGFRRFEIRDSIMLINGKRIVFKGVNRHEFCAQGGRVVTEDMVRKDIVTMKQNNINAIRTSHYPNPSVLYRLCDEYGIYVIDETNLETHGVWDAFLHGIKDISYLVPGNRPEYLALVLDRARSMFERDKNHACILIWSCGNESMGGNDILEMSRYFHRMDPDRAVHYEGACRDRDTRCPETSDIESTMYTPAADIEAWLKENRQKPCILCEYTHAMGNSCGAMHKYTDLTDKEPLFQGGFIWDYIDQSMTLHDRYGNEYQGYGGDFGDRPCDYNFSGNGIVYGKDRDPSPKMQEVRYNYQSISVRFEIRDETDAAGAVIKREPVLRLTNRYLFTPLSAFDCRLRLDLNGQEICSAKAVYEAEPLSESTVRLPETILNALGSFSAAGVEGLLREGSAKDDYTLTVSFLLREDTLWAKAGHEVAYGQHIWHPDPSFTCKASGEGKCFTDTTQRRMEIIHGWCNTGVKGEDFDILFSGLHGGLVSYRYGGKELILSQPKPNFWRALTDNDTANQLGFAGGQWKIAGMYASHKHGHGRKADDYVVEEKDGLLKVTYTYHLPTTPKKDCQVCYTVFPCGTVQVDLTLEASADVGILPELSMMFTLDADYDRLTWYGLGPDETYPDRRHAKLGIYENRVRDNMARYLVPQECGNKMDVRWARITDENGRGLLFEGDGLCFSALPYSPHQLDNAFHPNELPPVLHTYVRIGTQMGIGGDDTWGALVHPEYLLDNTQPMTVSFRFKGV